MKNWSPKKQQRSRMGYFVNFNGRLFFLLVENDDGTFSIPGGAIERNESEIDACIRETREETLLDINKEKINYLGHIKAGRITHLFASFETVFPLLPQSRLPEEVVVRSFFCAVERVEQTLTSKFQKRIWKRYKKSLVG